MADFCMPSLGADMRTGTLVEWKVKPGDRLQNGDIIADVETDKGIMEIEVFEDCVVDEILLAPNTEVPVGTVMARIHSDRGAGKAPIATPEPAKKEQPPIPPPEPIPGPAKVTAEPEHLRASPLARKLATELGVDLNQIQGTGPEGAIQKADVEQAAALKAKSVKPVAVPLPRRLNCRQRRSNQQRRLISRSGCGGRSPLPCPVPIVIFPTTI